VGASISGLSTGLAILILKPSANVTFYDKRPIGYRIICAEGISQYMLDEMHTTIPKQFVAATINAVRIYSP
jgi:flavin-dependent dehydrogenase